MKKTSQVISTFLSSSREVKVSYKTLETDLKQLPTLPGIYLILTNTPVSVLAGLEDPVDEKHYKIAKKIEDSRKLPGNCIISISRKSEYVVYSGHAQSIRQRAREHFKGSKGTGCLAIFTYKDLREYKWSFKYMKIEELGFDLDSKVLRTYLEQQLRSKIGWPILCTQ